MKTGKMMMFAVSMMAMSASAWAGGTEGHGGEPLSVLFLGGMERALHAMEALPELPEMKGSDDSGRKASRALYRQKRAQWMEALQFGITHADRIRVVEKELRDHGTRVAAIARVTRKGERSIELSLPFLMASGLSDESAFVLAVHETGHWITSDQELRSHSDLNQVGIQLFAAYGATFSAQASESSKIDSISQEQGHRTCELIRGRSSVAIPLLLQEAGASGKVMDLYNSLLNKTNTLGKVADAFIESKIPSLLPLAGEILELSKTSASGDVIKFFEVIQGLNAQSKKLATSLQGIVRQACDPQTWAAQAACRKDMRGSLKPHFIWGERITRFSQMGCAAENDTNVDNVYTSGDLEVGDRGCMGTIREVDYCEGKVYLEAKYYSDFSLLRYLEACANVGDCGQ